MKKQGNKYEQETRELKTELLVLREIVKKIGWVHVAMIKDAAHKNKTTIKKEDALKEAKSLSMLLHLLKDGGQQLPK